MTGLVTLLQKRSRQRECHTRDFRRVTSPTELEEFISCGDTEDADYGAFVGGGGEDVAFGGEGEEGYGGFVGGDDVDGCEGEGVENEDFAGVLWGDWCCGGVGGLEGWG